MNQADLARLTGLNRGTISNIVNGTKGLGHESLIAIAHALKIPSETVFRAAGLLPASSGDPLSDKAQQLMGLVKEADDATLDVTISTLEVPILGRSREFCFKRPRMPQPGDNPLS